ncbi:MAG: DUF3102 domain-containing protein [Clostridia bacterium]|nr:DUF3102 domain-containing protein [Clostridia bacterium]MBQ8708110.1 DUF3102 domain-containing protein [Succinivibrionaceae bacterium]MBQ8708156.1 DUF3102 domain-containing protein [Succinivibrionaceae bacterium]
MNEMTTLANIERRISFHIQGAYANILEVGRCLIEAKDSGLVPHGQWEEWVQRMTGMSERNAQRLMKAAREVSPDSAMAKLPISKITAILALPEPQREAVAERAVEENQSLRELNETIEAMKASLDEERNTESRVTRERDTALEINKRIYRERVDVTRERDDLKRDLEKAREAEKQAKERSARYADKVLAAQRETEKARQALQDALDNPPKAKGISAEAQAEIDRLTAQLRDAEQMAEYQAQEREKAQAELLDMRTQAARGELPGREDLTADAVGLAARTFIGAVGYVPHSDRLLTMSDGEREEIATYAAMLREWSENVLHSVNMARQAVVIEGV